MEKLRERVKIKRARFESTQTALTLCILLFTRVKPVNLMFVYTDSEDPLPGNKQSNDNWVDTTHLTAQLLHP